MLLNNRYQVIRTLGSGGFGETFLAEDIQMPSGRKCVIKQLKPIKNNPQIYQLVQERFQREAAILEELGGNNHQIPGLYAYFQAEEQFYLIQEYVEGDTLRAKLQKQGLFDESAVREILASLLPVLEYVHSMGIVHRDIKPDNIILRLLDNQPVLIDFGAVRETMGTVVNSQGSPTSSIVIGTPGYMPSEQAMGRPVYTSDLYSLGMSAIYLLTGKQPQELQTDPNTGEFIWKQYASNVSPEMSNVLDRAIAYHPKERFKSARAMLEALSGVIVTPVAPTVPFIRGEEEAETQPPTFARSNTSRSNSLVSEEANMVSVSEQAIKQVTSQQTSSQTITTSPTQNNGNQQILLGSLVAGGLIGGSMIIGLSMNKPNPEAANVVKPPSTEQKQTNSQVSQDSNFSSRPNNSSKIGQKILSQQSSKTTQPESTPVSPSINTNNSDTSPVNNISTDYSWLSERLVKDVDLANKNGLELDIMRNSIFARHGRRFQISALQKYFDKQPWYRPKYLPNEFPMTLISKIEMQNIELIQKYQNRQGLRYFPK
ncbi:MAG: YARHG domain-containing protein [Cyanobacteria bacterium P01_A01_bin.84]